MATDKLDSAGHKHLPPQRKFISPQPGDTIETIAARELPDVPLEQAVQQLSSWNLHIFLMRQPHGLVTGSDVVFVEAPQVEGRMTLLNQESLNQKSLNQKSGP